MPFVALLTFALISCQPKEKYIWNTGMSAPKNYIAGGPYVSFYAKGRSVSGASANVGINPGWGFTSGGYTGGEKYKPLPDSASIRWRCGTDLVEYRADFSLPSAKVKEFFNKDIRNADGSPDYYRTLVAGMAPGGNITIWAKGGEQSIEIMKTKAKKISETDRYDPSTVTLWSSKGQEASDILTYLYVHGVPYDVWEKDQRLYSYDIGLHDDTQNINPSISNIHTKDGSVFQYFPRPTSTYSLDILPDTKSWSLPNNNLIKNEKLPVQLYLKWQKISSSHHYYKAIVVMPSDLENDMSPEDNRFVINILSNDIAELLLINKNGTRSLMKFKFQEYSDSDRTPTYSLPKDYRFPKWQGRTPLEPPKNFEYWQEK